MRNGSTPPSATRVFAIWVIATIVVLTVVAAAIAIRPVSNIQHDANYYGAVTGLLSTIFGTAAAVGGAVATIRLAQWAGEISQQQDLRDARGFVEERLALAVEVLSRTAADVAGVVSAATIVDALLDPAIDDTVTNDIDAFYAVRRPIADGELRVAVISFAAALTRLADSLRSVQKNTIARRCYLRGVDASHSAVRDISVALSKTGVPSSELWASDDLSSVIQAIGLATQKHSDPDLRELVTGRLAMAARRSSAPTAPKHAGLRLFLFAGDLLLVRADTGKFHAAYGAGILRDIFRALPNSGIIRDVFLELYSEPGVIAAVQRTIIDFDANAIADFSFLTAVNLLDEHRDLMLSPL